MSHALLCCNAAAVDAGFDRVWSLSRLTELELSARGISSSNLCEVALPDLDAGVRQRIEDGLAAEAARGGDFAWAEIAFQHVHWRFVRYYQYRLRLEALIEREAVDRLTINSADDGDLIEAGRAACDRLGVAFEVRAGPCDPPSSKLSYLAAYDLPSGVSLIEALVARVLAFDYRRKRIGTFYQPYNNLGGAYPCAAVLTWRRSICFPGLALPEMELGRPRSFVALDTPIRRDHGISCDPRCWPGFDHFDRDVLASAFSYFRARYATAAIDRVYHQARSFFRRSRAGRLVLNSDNTCATRLLSKAARAADMHVDYLPHGLIMEDLSLATGTDCGVDRILAWNDASAAAYARRGIDARVIVHPTNVARPAHKRPLPADLSRLRVLIMPPDWVGLSFAGRPDCFERDLLDALAVLHRLGVTSAEIKLHNSIPEVLQAKLIMLEAIRPHAAVGFTIIDSHIPARQLYDRFDLAIIGPTTGLLEASQSATLFVGFRALMRRFGLFDRYELPHAETVDELELRIRNYDVAAAEAQCERLGASLRTGCHPFSEALESGVAP